VKRWILAHRGRWDNEVGPNSATSIRAALQNGFGVETDIRDLDGKIVISHDPCLGANYESFLGYLNSESRFAINIKSDGLLGQLRNYREQIEQSDSFVFDCSFPELLKYKQAGIAHAIRMSEFEREIPWKPNFLWLDAFESDWWLEDVTVLRQIESTPTIVVSPELHKRDKNRVWERVLELHASGLDISLCTDLPDEIARLAGVE
jgi:glycerophosphoryl diester phosphodiesterase